MRAAGSCELFGEPRGHTAVTFVRRLLLVRCEEMLRDVRKQDRGG